MILQAALVLRQGYVPEKFRVNWAQNSHLKWCISLGLGDRQSHPIQRVTVPLVDIETCRVYMYCIYSIYTFLYSIHTFVYSIKIWETHTHNFCMVYSNRTVVVLLHKHTLPVSDCWHLLLSEHLALSFPSALSRIVHMLLWASLNTTAYVNSSFIFFKWAYYI